MTSDDKRKSTMGQSNVRFASHDEEFEPETDLRIVQTLTGHENWTRDDLNEEAEQELRKLKTTLQNNIQSARVQHHNFEAISLPGSTPASRVCTYMLHVQEASNWIAGSLWNKYTKKKTVARRIQRSLSRTISHGICRSFTTFDAGGYKQWRWKGSCRYCVSKAFDRTRCHDTTAIRFASEGQGCTRAICHTHRLTACDATVRSTSKESRRNDHRRTFPLRQS